MATKEAAAPRLKLVIRRLPPTLPEEIFWTSVAPWTTDSTCTWKRYIKGRPSAGPYDQAVHSRAYCLMTDVNALVNFHRGFDGHLFRSKTGLEYQAVVEFAPVQKTPLATKAKNDARQGTIDDVPAARPTSTPLLEYLRSQGIKSSKKKNKTESSSTDIARNAAVAAVASSAARRNPKDQGAPLVAGKGRAVVAQGGGETPGAKAGKSRSKKAKAAKAIAEAAPAPTNTVKNFPALASGPLVATTQPAPPPKALTTVPPATSAPSQPPTGEASGRGGRGRGRGGGGRGRGGESRGGAPNMGAAASQGTDPSAAQPGRGRGRGGGADGRGRTAKDMVTGILSRNARGQGRGGGVGGREAAPDPRTARIDG